MINHKVRKQQGFTLVELMVVLAIIGVLSAIAIPQYQAYKVRTEAMAFHAAAKPFIAQVERYVAMNPNDVPTAAEAGVPVIADIDDDINPTCAGMVQSVAYTVANNQPRFTITAWSADDAMLPAKCDFVDGDGTGVVNTTVNDELQGMVLTVNGTVAGNQVSWAVDAANSTLNPAYFPHFQ